MDHSMDTKNYSNLMHCAHTSTTRTNPNRLALFANHFARFELPETLWILNLFTLTVYVCVSAREIKLKLVQYHHIHTAHWATSSIWSSVDIIIYNYRFIFILNIFFSLHFSSHSHAHRQRDFFFVLSCRTLNFWLLWNENVDLIVLKCVKKTTRPCW